MAQLIDRSFLNAQADGVDVHLAGKRSLFLGTKPLKTQNFVFGWNDIDSTIEGGYGSTTTFYLEQDCDYLGKVEAVYDYGAVASTGSGSNYPRYVDWLGFASMENVIVRWSSNRIQEFSGDDLMITHALTRRSDDDQSELVGGGLESLPATRAANAALSSYKVYVPLDCLVWGNKPGSFLPYNIEVFRDRIRIEIKTRPRTSIIETDGSDITGSINSIKLRIQKVHVTDTEQDQIISAIKAPSPELSIGAHARLTTVQEHQNDEVVSATSNDQTYTLNASRPTKELIAYWRLDSDLPNGSEKSTIRHFNFQEISELELTGISRKILDRVSGEWLKYRVMNQFHTGDPSSNIYAIPHSLAPEAANDQMGYLNYSTISQPKLTIKTAGSAAGKLNILSQTLNALILAEGDLRPLNS